MPWSGSLLRHDDMQMGKGQGIESWAGAKKRAGGKDTEPADSIESLV